MPAPSLSAAQASAMLIGIVVGIGIFKTPPVVAANVASEFAFIALWVVGGVLTMIGALCYAELGSSRPHAGGEYQYLKEAYGDGLSFLFAWGRMTVIQSGAIAAVAFAYGDYANVVLPLGTNGPAVHAALSVGVLSALQLGGTSLSGTLQIVLTALTVLLIVAMAAAGFIVAVDAPEVSTAVAPEIGGAVGLALVFILLTYGGWNEVAYLSGEIRDAKGNMLRVLVAGTGIVVLLYLMINLALVLSVGLEGLRREKLVTEPIELLFGRGGVLVAAVIVCCAALSTLFGTIFTGARTIMALGEGFSPLRFVGERGRGGSPSRAILLQGAIVLGLIGFGATARDGFTAMVEYTAPTFWAFMALIGLSLIIFRLREPDRAIPYKVPLYPLPPIILCVTALYLAYASVLYTGVGALVGLAILATGITVYLLGQPRSKTRVAPDSNESADGPVRNAKVADLPSI